MKESLEVVFHSLTDSSAIKLTWNQDVTGYLERVEIDFNAERSNSNGWVSVKEVVGVNMDLLEHFPALERFLANILERENGVKAMDGYEITEMALRSKAARYISADQSSLESTLKTIRAELFVKNIKQSLSANSNDEEIVEVFSDQIKTVEQLSQALSGDLFNDYSTEVFVGVVKKIIPTVRNVQEMQFILDRCNVSQIRLMEEHFYAELVPRCYDTAKNKSEFIFLLKAARKMSKEMPNFKIKLLEYYKIPAIIKNDRESFHNILHQLGNRQEVKIFLDEVASVLDESLFYNQEKSDQLLSLWFAASDLDYRQRIQRDIETYKQLHDYLPSSIKNSIIEHLFDPTDYDCSWEDEAFVETVKQELIAEVLDNCELFIHTADAYVLVSQTLSSEQKTLLYQNFSSKLPSFVKTFQDFEAIHAGLTVEDQKQFDEKMVELTSQNQHHFVDPRGTQPENASIKRWNDYVAVQKPPVSSGIDEPVSVPETHAFDEPVTELNQPTLNQPMPAHSNSTLDSQDLRGTILKKIEDQITRIQASERDFFKGRFFLRKGDEKISAFRELEKRIKAVSPDVSLNNVIEGWEKDCPANKSLNYRQILHKHRLGLEESLHLGATDSEQAIDEMKMLLKPSVGK